MKIYNRDRSLNPWTVTSSGAIKALSKEPPSLYSVDIDRPPGFVNDYLQLIQGSTAGLITTKCFQSPNKHVF